VAVGIGVHVPLHDGRRNERHGMKPVDERMLIPDIPRWRGNVIELL
jgi:hypothetical protein